MGNLLGRTWSAVTRVVSVDGTTMAAKLESSFLVQKFTNLQRNQKDLIIHICSQTLTAISESVSKDFAKSRFTVLIYRAVS